MSRASVIPLNQLPMSADDLVNLLDEYFPERSYELQSPLVSQERVIYEGGQRSVVKFLRSLQARADEEGATSIQIQHGEIHVSR